MKRFPNFFMSFFEEQKVPGIYTHLKYLDYEVALGDTNVQANEPDALYSISLIPEYFGLKVRDGQRFKVRPFHQNNYGYSIFLDGITDLNDFLKEQFKGNYRNLVKRRKRLESCFNIRYATYYGAIGQQDYQLIMKELQAMLVRRFGQRNDTNLILNKWDQLVNTTYGQIIDKKASLFVIYNGDRPIDISLNYHFHKMMFGAVSSYDIDYHKFGLGNLEKIKILEWCLANGYSILEMGFGDLNYKKTWSNRTYYFETQVIYDTSSLKSNVMGQLEVLRISTKEFLKKRNVHRLYHHLKQLRSAKDEKNRPVENAYEYEILPRPTALDNDGLSPVNFRNDQYPFPLKLYINDFIYSTLEHYDAIEVGKVLREENTYIISGSKEVRKIRIMQKVSTP